MLEKKWMSKIIGKNGWLPGGDPEEIKKQQLTCVAASASHTEKKKKRTINLWKRKRKNNQSPGAENKMDVAHGRRKAQKNNTLPVQC